MSGDDSAATLVARFLRSNNYHETLNTFLREANLPLDTALSSRNVLTIETILQEKRLYDIDQSYEKIDLNEANKPWTSNAPEKPTVIGSIPGSSNILHLSSLIAKDCLIVTTANKTIHTLSLDPPFSLLSPPVPVNDSPILACSSMHDRYLAWTSMSGTITLYDSHSNELIDKRQDHRKFVVSVATQDDEAGSWIATAAWDSKVLLYRLHVSNCDRPDAAIVCLGLPVATINLPTNPMSVIFAQHPELRKPVLVISRRDSTILEFYLLPSPDGGGLSMSTSRAFRDRSTLKFLGRQNLAPYSTAWIAFTPAFLVICPTDPSLLAVVTSHVPHMKLIVVRLLFPTAKEAKMTYSSHLKPEDSSVFIPSEGNHPHSPIPVQTAAASIPAAAQDREAAAIQIQVNTWAPQTAYSTPYAAWRPDGTGLWVNGDDGIVRGIELATGKVVACLAGGHEPGSKVRCLHSVVVVKNGSKSSKTEGREYLFSGGFDRRLIAWVKSY